MNMDLLVESTIDGAFQAIAPPTIVCFAGPRSLPKRSRT